MSSKQKQKKISIQTKTNRNKLFFGCVLVCFLKSKTKNFGLFRFVSLFRTYIESTETNGTVLKQTETNQNNHKFLKNTQICPFSNCLGWSSVCFGSFETSKILFRYRSETTEQTVSKQTEKTGKNRKKRKNRKNPKFPKKYQNMLPIKLFRLVFCFFRFNRNIKTLCFGIELNIEAKHRSKHFVTDNAETSFSSSFGCFESKLVSKDNLVRTMFLLVAYYLIKNSLWFPESRPRGCPGPVPGPSSHPASPDPPGNSINRFIYLNNLRFANFCSKNTSTGISSSVKTFY